MSGPTVVAVVGCGNIGSRHLQGLARLAGPAEIHMVEPSTQALALAQARFAEMDPAPTTRLIAASGPEALPEMIDLMVVATSAAVRLPAMQAALAGRRVRRLVLEKFLFQRMRDYDTAAALIAEAGSECFVNTPRRMWPAYGALRDRLAGRGPVTVAVETSRRNGMASNAIHFLDLAAFLTGDPDGFALDASGLTPQQEAARRGAAIEFGGVLTGRSAAGHALIHRSRLDDDAPHSVAVFARGLRMVIDEIAGVATIWSEDAGWRPESVAVEAVRQSALTHLLTPAAGRPALPGFTESARLHRQCLAAFLKAAGRDPDDPDALCPIT